MDGCGSQHVLLLVVLVLVLSRPYDQNLDSIEEAQYTKHRTQYSTELR